jgi:hypothetical protein
MIEVLKRRRIGAATGVALLGVVASGPLLASGSAAARTIGGPPVAHTARTLKATDKAELHKVSVSGSNLVEEGKATGTLPGKMRADVNVGASISGNFTIYVHGGGTIKGHGTATPHGSGPYESFKGSIVVTGGTGRYIHAHGHTGLYGTIDRESEEYPLVIQTTGTLSY